MYQNTLLDTREQLEIDDVKGTARVPKAHEQWVQILNLYSFVKM